MRRYLAAGFVCKCQRLLYHNFISLLSYTNISINKIKNGNVDLFPCLTQYSHNDNNNNIGDILPINVCTEPERSGDGSSRATRGTENENEQSGENARDVEADSLCAKGNLVSFPSPDPFHRQQQLDLANNMSECWNACWLIIVSWPHLHTLQFEAVTRTSSLELCNFEVASASLRHLLAIWRGNSSTNI